jgi:catechol 2,3-dioxygenase-like lactoylglutathione lyase family enzyme
LGFRPSKPFEFFGCEAVDLDFSVGGIRFLARSLLTKGGPLAALVNDRLTFGAGLLGWSWACKNVWTSRQRIEAQALASLSDDASDRTNILLPPKLSPGAATMLEPLTQVATPVHPNFVTGIDHVVVTVTNVDAAADLYERHFGLRAVRKTIAERRYAFLKVGEGSVVIELVGPNGTDRGPLGGQVWGLAFRTANLDGTFALLSGAGIGVSQPHAALQGGRIASLPMQLGGIQIAFLGD